MSFLVFFLLEHAQAATLIVTKTADTNDFNCNLDCSLREAISVAASGDTINVPAGVYTLTIPAPLQIIRTLALVGAGADTTIIQAATTPGVADHRVFNLLPGDNLNVAISGVTIRHGNGVPAGAIFNFGETLTLTNCTITENRTGPGFAAGAIGNSFGGTLTVIDSTISNNTAVSAGGIFNFNGTVTVINSTISNNTTSGLGGGFINQEPTASLTLINSTVTGNTASLGGGIHNGRFNAPGASLTLINTTVTGNTAIGGGGIHNSVGTVELANTIIANNPSGGDCGRFFPATFTSLGYNLDSDDTCDLNSVGDLPNVNPLLGPLQDDGGFTDTHALLAGSPAIDAGNPAPPGSGGNACEATDQRGISRPQGTACDIGAFELVQFVSVAIDIKPGSDPNSINCNNHNGVIPVAILTTETFDATTVDHTTVAFEGASETHVNKKSGEPRRHEEDVDNDGDTDLVFHFRLRDTALTCESTEGTLTGETFDGMAIEGTDNVRMVGGTTIITVGQPIPKGPKK